MSKSTKGGIREIEHESHLQHLDKLLEDHFREPTIQDVGFWLVEFPLEPLPPRLLKVLSPWLEEHNDLTIKQSRRGRSHSDTRDVFPLITRMHREAMMSIEAACLLVCERLELEVDPSNLRRAFDRARTPHQRFQDDQMKVLDEIVKGGDHRAAMQKAGERFKKATAKKEKKRK